MGKRKRNQNVVKVDVGEYAFRKGPVLPVLVQHSSKDGRRFEKAVHQVPTPRQRQPLPTFDPSPMLDAPQTHPTPVGDEPTGEPDGSEWVRLCSLLSRRVIMFFFSVAGPSAHVVWGP